MRFFSIAVERFFALCGVNVYWRRRLIFVINGIKSRVPRAVRAAALWHLDHRSGGGGCGGGGGGGGGDDDDDDDDVDDGLGGRQATAKNLSLAAGDSLPHYVTRRYRCRDAAATRRRRPPTRVRSEWLSAAVALQVACAACVRARRVALTRGAQSHLADEATLRDECDDKPSARDRERLTRRRRRRARGSCAPLSKAMQALIERLSPTLSVRLRVAPRVVAAFDGAALRATIRSCLRSTTTTSCVCACERACVH